MRLLIVNSIFLALSFFALWGTYIGAIKPDITHVYLLFLVMAVDSAIDIWKYFKEKDANESAEV